jgi:hypothetical protein
LEQGIFVDDSFYNMMSKDITEVLLLWPLFHLWTWNAFILQKLVIVGLKPGFTTFLQHLFQSVIFAFVMVVVYVYDMGFT